LQIFEDHKRCEIDPAKLREGESLEANLVSWQFAKSYLQIFILFYLFFTVISINASRVVK